jgi:signal transduction histidine kinase/putative methionine-R-sulfoxide reductase with GAF domain
VTLKSDTRAESARIVDLEAALAREMRISAALREVGLALGTTLDLDQLLELILSKITDALEADRATLYLLDESKDELVSRIVQGDEVKSIRLKVGHGIAGHVARTGKSLNIKDAYKDPRFNPEWDMLSGYRTRTILVAPMKNHLGRTIGVVQVLNKKRGEFSEVDAVILAALATQAAISIDNSRLFLSVTQKNMQLLDIKEQLEHRIRDLKLLFDLESAMGRASSLEELFTAVLSEAMRVCEAKAAAVLLKEGPTGVPTLYVFDDKHKRLRTFPVKEGQGFIGWALRHNELIHSADAKNDPRNDEALAELAGIETTNAVAVPLEGEDSGTMGAIALYNKRSPQGFSEDDRALVVLISANASTAIRLQLARESREREERLTTIGRLLSGVIHDLKTPLTVISGYVQLMQTAESKEQREEFAELILKQFDHISAMQRDVLEFARGEKSVLVRKVYLSKFFSDVKVQLEGQLAYHDVELVVDLQDKGTARFDEGKILRVIHNLARNAAEAMADKGGKLTIKITRDKDDGAIVMTFTDNGPGIPKEIEHRLFQSFVTSGKKGGTGLGLAIVKKIAEEHGGSVTVSSSARGAKFELRLPQPKPKEEG